MWSEPMPGPGRSDTSISEFGSRASNDVLLYEGVRRFIIIDGVENNARDGNSICV